MVGKFHRGDGKLLPLTRVSNTTFIGSPEKLEIGNNVFIGHFNFIDASFGLSIDEGCQITNYVSILSHSSHNSIRVYGEDYNKSDSREGYLTGKVTIGAYTFIGPHTVIMPGSHIGKGSIVSAFSYVKGVFPDFSVISGNPAVIVGNTKDIDRPFLIQHPELLCNYEKWAGKIN